MATSFTINKIAFYRIISTISWEYLSERRAVSPEKTYRALYLPFSCKENYNIPVHGISNK